MCRRGLGCLPGLARCTCFHNITLMLMLPRAGVNSFQESAELVWVLNIKSLHVFFICNDRKYNPCSSILRNTQELCHTTKALRNIGVHDLCISSEIFTPHWGAKWRKWSVTNIPLLNTTCESTLNCEKCIQQPDSFLMCLGAYMLIGCSLTCLILYVHIFGGLPLWNAWYCF